RCPCALTDLSFFYRYRAPLLLRSFPTRRSSDLFGISAGIGLIILFGVNTINGIILIAVMKDNLKEYQLIKAIKLGVKSRIRSILDRKSTRLNSSHVKISYAVFCLKKKKNKMLAR